MQERQNTCQGVLVANQFQTVFLQSQEAECQDNLGKRMKHLEDLQKELVQMKKKLNEASVRCHKLNIDVATMFNPELLETLENYKEECELCLSRMSKTLNEPSEMAALPITN